MRKAAICTIILIIALYLVGARPAESAPLYRYKDLHLGTGYFSTYAFGINASGQVVGYARTQLGDRGFFYDGSTMNLLPTLPAPYDVGSYATAVNAAGQVVGYSTSSGGARAFLWTSSGGMQDLGILTGAPFSRANGINDAGQVVGYFTSTQQRAFLYTPGVGMEEVPLLPGGLYNEARGINNAGQVAGLSDSSTTEYDHRDHAFLYTPGAGVQDLAFLPGSQTEISWANALNNHSPVQVVGMSSTTNLWINHPVLWMGGGIQDLGALHPEDGGEASAINNFGQVVGGAALPFLYSGGHIYDLNSLVQNLPSGIYLTGASGINDRGQIAATSLDSHAYLLTPIPFSVSILELLLFQ